MTETALSPKEIKEVTDICMEYFRKETKSEDKAKKLMADLATLIQQPAAKLVHLGNLVFLTLVKDKGVIEFHTMGEEKTSDAYTKDMKALAKYLFRIGATKIYSYTDDPKFGILAKRSRMGWETSETTGEDGKKYTVYTLEKK